MFAAGKKASENCAKSTHFSAGKGLTELAPKAPPPPTTTKTKIGQKRDNENLAAMIC